MEYFLFYIPYLLSYILSSPIEDQDRKIRK